MKNGKMAHLLIAAFAITALLWSCGGPGQPSGTEEETALTISVRSPISKNLEPGINMTCSSFHVTGDGPGTESFDINISEDTTLGVETGEWTVTAVGLNPSDIPLGEGVNTVDVTVGQVTQCPITVTEYVGPGTVDLETHWTGGTIFNPIIESDLIPTDGAQQDISSDWIPGTDMATYDASLTNGWYGTIFRLFESSTLVGGWVELVRVVKDQTTAGVIDFTVNPSAGQLEILIDTDFYEDLDLSVNVPEGDITLYQGQSKTITASAPEGFVGQWYVNGQQYAVAEAATLDAADYVEGATYNLGLIAWSTDGRRAASRHWQIVKDNTVHTVEAYVTVPLAQEGYLATVELLDGASTVIGSDSVTMDVPTSPHTLTIGAVPPGTYYLRGWVDMDSSGTLNAGDKIEYFDAVYTQPGSPNFIVPDNSPHEFNIIQGTY